MNFETIIKDVKSDASKIESAFKTLFNEAPTYAAIVGADIVRMAPLVTSVATILGGAPAGSETALIIAAIKTKLAAIYTVTNTVDASTSIPSLLTNVQTTLPTLLSAVQVENPSLVSKIESNVSQISSEIATLLSANSTNVPSPTAVSTAAVKEIL